MHMPRKRTKKKKGQLKEPDVPYQRTISELFPPDWILEKARETGMLKRERDIDPVVFFWTLVLNFGIELRHAIVGFQRSYGRYAGSVVAYSSFYNPIFRTLNGYNLIFPSS